MRISSIKIDSSVRSEKLDSLIKSTRFTRGPLEFDVRMKGSTFTVFDNYLGISYEGKELYEIFEGATIRCISARSELQFLVCSDGVISLVVLSKMIGRKRAKEALEILGQHYQYIKGMPIAGFYTKDGIENLLEFIAL